MFDDDGVADRVEAAALLADGERVGEVGLAGREIDVRTLCRDRVDVDGLGEVDRVGELAGDLRWWCAGFAGESEGDRRREDGVELLGRNLDTEVVARIAAVVERVGEDGRDLLAEGDEHGSRFL